MQGTGWALQGDGVDEKPYDKTLLKMCMVDGYCKTEWGNEVLLHRTLAR